MLSASGTSETMTRGESIRSARIKAGLSLQEVAEPLGAHKSVICAIEKNRGTASVEFMLSMATVIGVSIDEMLYGKPGPQEIFVPEYIGGNFGVLILDVNGKKWLLPKGRRLTVPRTVAEAYVRFAEGKRFQRRKKTDHAQPK